MSARADIFLGDGAAKLAVPVEAIGTEELEDGKTERFVWVERDGVARRVIVEVGLSDDRWEEITSGLSAGDRVITGPARVLRGLLDGDKVRQREKDEGEDGGESGDGDTEAGADDAETDEE